MARSFQQRLNSVMERGNLRVADVARWFGRRHSTLRGWVIDGREPAGTPTDVRALFERLVELETKVRGSQTLTSHALRRQIATEATTAER